MSVQLSHHYFNLVVVLLMEIEKLCLGFGHSSVHGVLITQDGPLRWCHIGQKIDEHVLEQWAYTGWIFGLWDLTAEFGSPRCWDQQTTDPSLMQTKVMDPFVQVLWSSYNKLLDINKSSTGDVITSWCVNLADYLYIIFSVFSSLFKLSEIQETEGLQY